MSTGWPYWTITVIESDYWRQAVSEDDTYRILARPSFEDMASLLRAYRVSQYEEQGKYPTTENIRFCKQHGWGWIEFLQASKLAGRSPI
jgi:hypothetical protein